MKQKKKVKQELDLSVGEDLETFIERIKNGEINKELDFKSSFFLCLLDKVERKKLEEKNEDFMKTFLWGRKADVSEAEWKESESNLKFSRSVCLRFTYLIDASKITKL